MDNTSVNDLLARLINGESEADLADELSKMLNTAIAQKKAKDEEFAKRKAEQQLDNFTDELFDFTVDFLRAYAPESLAAEIDRDAGALWDDIRSALKDLITILQFATSLKTKLPPVLPISLDSLFKVEEPKKECCGKCRPETTTPKEKEKKPNAANINNMSDEELDEWLKKLIKAVEETAKG